MSKIFISHSSVNNAHALAVAEWMKQTTKEQIAKLAVHIAKSPLRRLPTDG